MAEDERDRQLDKGQPRPRSLSLAVAVLPGAELSHEIAAPVAGPQLTSCVGWCRG